MMALAAGTRLGPYAITGPIGAGGMGEVYKATDTRLDRTVAIKVLPEHVASDPELKQRFEREAKTLAALSHPHICPVFDVGSQAGIDFLVMEYLEGETLEQRLKKGALPLDQALQCAIQIADAIAPGARPYDFMTFAPDGRRLAVTLYEGQQDVFIYDLTRGDFDRFTSDPHNDFFATWSPDGRTLVFSSVRRGQIDLYSGPVDKSSPPGLLYANQYPKWASSWSPDGKVLAFTERRPETAMDVWMYSMDEKQARSFRHGAFNEKFPQFSPDGRWLAFASDELGQFEIYVVPYPGPGPTCKVSTSGGDEPRWSQDGKELFYRKGTTAMVIDVANRDFCNPAPRPLFDGLDTSEGAWDVSPRGDVFVTLARREPPRLHLVLNWFEELKRLVPTN